MRIVVDLVFNPMRHIDQVTVCFMGCSHYTVGITPATRSQRRKHALVCLRCVVTWSGVVLGQGQGRGHDAPLSIADEFLQPA